MGKTERQLQKLMSHLIILIIHVIKIVAENRVCSSWTGSIYNALLNIKQANTRENNSYRYKTVLEFHEDIYITYTDALYVPAQECFDSKYEDNTTAFEQYLQPKKDLVIQLTLSLLNKIYEKKPFTKQDIDFLISNFMGF